MSVDQLTSTLQAVIATNEGNRSPTVERVCAAFQLLHSLDTMPAVILHDDFKLSQRVIVTSTSESGSITKYDDESCTFSIVLDCGQVVHNVAACDLTEVAGDIITNNERLNFVSRILWVNALSENRIPLNGAHLDPELGPWAIFEQAFQLTTPWTPDLWNSSPTLVALNFEWWLYLFVEATRTKLKGADYLALLLVEETYKHVACVENLYKSSANDDLVVSFIEGVAELVRYYPVAVEALGNSSTTNNFNGSFSLLRHIVSTQALKVLRTVYRKPKTDQYVIDRQLLLQRYKFYLDLQKIAEDELRAKKCESIFGDGQACWNAGWLYSLNSGDPKTVCIYLRQGISFADVGNNNDFVSAKCRWDLAGNIMLGGEGEVYDIRDIDALRSEAETFEEAINLIGMTFYVRGESIFAKLVMGQLQNENDIAPFVRQPLKVELSKYADKGLPACHYCQTGTEALKACGACKKTRYCSRECQKKDFKVHKKVCKK